MSKTNLFGGSGFGRTISKLLILVICIVLIAPQAVFAANINWKEQQSKHFVVYYEQASEGRRVLKTAERLFPKMVSDFNYRPPRKIIIYVYHNHSSFLASSPQGIDTAYSQPFMSRIFISATKDSVDSAVVHELCHVMFLQSMPDSSNVPFWFVEGLAIYQSQVYANLSEAESYALQGEVDSISDLSQEQPKSIQEQRRVAVEGYLIIQYFVDKYGKNAINDLIKNLQRGMVFPLALEQSMDVSEKELDRAWYVYAAGRSREVYVESLKYFGFMIMSFLLLISTGIWFRRRRKTLEELEQDEGDEDEDISDYNY